jgi:hypothetical protein
MSTLENDLANLNFEYLMLARECARSNAMEASWRFGVDQRQIDVLANLTIENMRDIAGASRAVITLLPAFTPNNFSLSIQTALLMPAVAAETI